MTKKAKINKPIKFGKANKILPSKAHKVTIAVIFALVFALCIIGFALSARSVYFVQYWHKHWEPN